MKDSGLSVVLSLISQTSQTLSNTFSTVLNVCELEHHVGIMVNSALYYYYYYYYYYYWSLSSDFRVSSAVENVTAVFLFLHNNVDSCFKITVAKLEAQILEF